MISVEARLRKQTFIFWLMRVDCNMFTLTFRYISCTSQAGLCHSSRTYLRLRSHSWSKPQGRRGHLYSKYRQCKKIPSTGVHLLIITDTQWAVRPPVGGQMAALAALCGLCGTTKALRGEGGRIITWTWIPSNNSSIQRHTEWLKGFIDKHACNWTVRHLWLKCYIILRLSSIHVRALNFLGGFISNMIS